MIYKFVKIPLRNLYVYKHIERGEDLTTIEPLPEWWDFFYWSPIPSAMRKLEEAREKQKQEYNRDWLAKQPPMTACSIDLHRWAFDLSPGNTSMWYQGCCIKHGLVVYSGTLKRALGAFNEIGPEGLELGRKLTQEKK